MRINHVALAMVAALGTGCTSITGMDGSTPNFACKAPDGITCTSVSGVYANAQLNNLPAQAPRHRAQANAQATASGQLGKYNSTPQDLPVAFPGMPIRSQSKTLRIWVTPWTDEDGDLHDQTFMYVLVEPGRWLVEHSRAETAKRSQLQLRPLPVTAAANAAPEPTKSGDSTSRDGVQSLRSFTPERSE